MKLVNSFGDEIELDERFDIRKIESLIKAKNNKGVDKYLNTVRSFPSHKGGGVPISINNDGVFVGDKKSKVKAERGLVLKKNS